MTDWYVRSGAGGTASGADWTNAKLTLAAAATASSAGDRIFVSEDHAESTVGAVTITFPGTEANPNVVYCVNHSGSVPPVSADLRTTGVVAIGASNSVLAVTGNAIINGVIFNGGTTGNSAAIQIGNGTTTNFLKFINCALNIRTTGTATISFGNTTSTPYFELENTTIVFTNGSGSNKNIGVTGRLVWKNTASAVSYNVQPTNVFTGGGGRLTEIILRGIDISAATGIIPPVGSNVARLEIFDCKINASATLTSPAQSGQFDFVDMLRSGSSADNVRSYRSRFTGTHDKETTIVRTGGASDGTTLHSMAITTTANSTWNNPFRCQPILIWNNSTSSITITVYGIWGGGSVPNNDDIFIEARYLSATAAGSAVNSTKADGLAANAALSSDSSTWSGSTTAFKMSVTMTPGQAGFIELTVCAAKASSTFYIDPRPEISGVTVEKTYAVDTAYINELSTGGTTYPRGGLQGIEEGLFP